MAHLTIKAAVRITLLKPPDSFYLAAILGDYDGLFSWRRIDAGILKLIKNDNRSDAFTFRARKI